MSHQLKRKKKYHVVPYVGTWIEISTWCMSITDIEVVPYVGTWIEIMFIIYSFQKRGRRSLRGNVDRNQYNVFLLERPFVVPYVGTWIEIIIFFILLLLFDVVPYVGTWIEINNVGDPVVGSNPSFPTWERG